MQHTPGFAKVGTQQMGETESRKAYFYKKGGITGLLVA